MKVLFFLAGMLTSSIAFAQFAFFDTKIFKEGSFYLGNYTHAYKQYQTNDKGALNNFSWLPYLSGQTRIDLGNSFRLLPELGFTWPKTGSHKKILKTYYFLRADIAYQVLEDIIWFRAGASAIMTNISGRGGTSTLNNGSSGNTTSFYLPASSSTAINYSYDLGIESRLPTYPAFSFRVQTFIFNLFESGSRQISYLLALGGHF